MLLEYKLMCNDENLKGLNIPNLLWKFESRFKNTLQSSNTNSHATAAALVVVARRTITSPAAAASLVLIV